MLTEPSKGPYPTLFYLAHPNLSFKKWFSVTFSRKPYPAPSHQERPRTLHHAQAHAYGSTYHTASRYMVYTSDSPTRSWSVLGKVSMSPSVLQMLITFLQWDMGRCGAGLQYPSKSPFVFYFCSHVSVKYQPGDDSQLLNLSVGFSAK